MTGYTDRDRLSGGGGIGWKSGLHESCPAACGEKMSEKGDLGFLLLNGASRGRRVRVDEYHVTGTRKIIRRFTNIITLDRNRGQLIIDAKVYKNGEALWVLNFQQI